jgi:hypothetical protein
MLDDLVYIRDGYREHRQTELLIQVKVATVHFGRCKQSLYCMALFNFLGSVADPRKLEQQSIN